MSIEREIEFKQRLNKAHYEKIKAHYFSKQSPFKQVNYYIDTPDFQIQSQKMALRIREKQNASNEMTLKVPDQVGLLEHNAQVTWSPKQDKRVPVDIIDSSIQEVLELRHVAVQDLLVLGALTTYRLETETAHGLLVLDHSTYLDTEDYELEFEVSDFETGKHAFHQLLDQLQLEPDTPKNKVQRFFEYKKHNQNINKKKI